MGQVWSKADFDGASATGFEGGRGGPLAVTAQNPGPDGVWFTSDDIASPMNEEPAWASVDNSTGTVRNDPLDRVRGFYSMHAQGANFALADGSIQFLPETIDRQVYQGLSTIAGSEVVTFE